MFIFYCICKLFRPDFDRFSFSMKFLIIMILFIFIKIINMGQWWMEEKEGSGVEGSGKKERPLPKLYAY